ncbi:hypothetical protein QUG28_27380 [Bacillus hominis]|uniref:hypothetical protein n=1 Tax=Bacillus hominis TaxID=2817478 RepID=UPI0025A03601|nr:hypothetical protein [Bacillus hominis]MDM5436375.1 hypothetical protein [Bacillus hominis]
MIIVIITNGGGIKVIYGKNNGEILDTVSADATNQYKLSKENLTHWINNHERIPKATVLFNPTYTGAFYTQ